MVTAIGEKPVLCLPASVFTATSVPPPLFLYSHNSQTTHWRFPDDPDDALGKDIYHFITAVLHANLIQPQCISRNNCWPVVRALGRVYDTVEVIGETCVKGILPQWTKFVVFVNLL